MFQPSNAFRVQFFAGSGHALTHVYMILFAPLLGPMAQDFGLGILGITFYVTLANVFFGLGAIPSGWLADRFGDKVLLIAFFFGCALGALLIGVADVQWQLTIGVVVLGSAASIYHPVGTSLISKSVAARGRALGINGIFGSAGTAAGPAYGALAATYGSWRWAFLGTVLPSLILGIWLWRSKLDIAAPASPAVTQKHQAPRDRRRFFVLSLLLAAMTCGGIYYYMVLTMLPTHLSSVAPQRYAGGVLAGIALIFGAGGQLIAGLMADRFECRGLYVLNLAITLPAMLLLSLLSGLPLVAATCGASIFMFSAQPIENTILATYSPQHWRGRIYGVKATLVFGIGGIGSWLGGIITEASEVSQVFVVAAGIVGVALACSFVASRIRL